MKGNRELLLATKPKLKALNIDGAEYFIRELTVGEVNEHLYGQQQRLIQIAQQQGIELDFDNEEQLSKQLAQVYDPYTLARTLALRLCDQQGVKLFDHNNLDDLNALSQLDKSVFEQLSEALAEEQVKNSPPDASSN
ncbi:hypothetical protein [Volucribacter amazonae]|uniref:Uncharacterized protein n=1 Tax=Volucribacter amazonae TaxID=256731 RepID=A0A9X4SKZ0_9PAST|nr:hypothetical protein [Volucribacter amazonae]MDG6894523.1 hypothetical protein [Volucribacter amazonae]